MSVQYFNANSDSQWLHLPQASVLQTVQTHPFLSVNARTALAWFVSHYRWHNTKLHYILLSLHETNTNNGNQWFSCIFQNIVNFTGIYIIMFLMRKAFWVLNLIQENFLNTLQVRLLAIIYLAGLKCKTKNKTD